MELNQHSKASWSGNQIYWGLLPKLEWSCWKQVWQQTHTVLLLACNYCLAPYDYVIKGQLAGVDSIKLIALSRFQAERF